MRWSHVPVDSWWQGRPVRSVVLLTLTLILISGCSGGSGGSTVSGGLTPATGAVGQICNTTSSTYSIELSSGSATATIEPDPIEGAYQGGIGGQIRGVTSVKVASGDNQQTEMLAWGSGATIRYGTIDAVVGSAILRHPGAVIDLATATLSGKQVIVYGTERGIGIAGPDENGLLADYAANGAWRTVPAGVRSLTMSSDGKTVFFASNDGYLQQLSLDALSTGEKCAQVIASFTPQTDESEAMAPVKVVQVGSKPVMFFKTQSALTSVAPRYEQVFGPIVKSMYDSTPYAKVTVPGGAQGSNEVTFAASDNSFNRFDRFIPTDIATDGTNLYVVGLAFTQDAVDSIASSKCSGKSDKVACLVEAARTGAFEKYQNSDGLFEVVAGFFVYRNLENLTQADHFAMIQLAVFGHIADAPPLTFAIGVVGDQGYVRGPNFLASLSRTQDDEGKEVWKFDATAETFKSGLMQGIPNRVLPYAGGAAATFTGVRSTDGSGASALELMDANRVFSVVDTGAIAVRVEGAGAQSKLIAALEMQSDRGGKLYLENQSMRKPIEITGQNAYVSRAAYNGVRLGFAWATGVASLKLAVQEGSSSDKRGELAINRSVNTTKEFEAFPDLSSDESLVEKLRGVVDMEFTPDGNLAVLYSGFKSGTWYHQVGLYSVALSGGKYVIQNIGTMATQKDSGGEQDHAGALLRIKGNSGAYQIWFSTAAGVYQWNCSSGCTGTAPNLVLPITNAIDVTMDAKGGNRVAWVSGFNAAVKDITKSGQPSAVAIEKSSGTTMTRLTGARVALSGTALAVATPYAAAKTFSFYNVSSGAPSLVAATTFSRFLDVKLFSSFPDVLLTNTLGGGIEIYQIAGD